MERDKKIIKFFTASFIFPWKYVMSKLSWNCLLIITIKTFINKTLKKKNLGLIPLCMDLNSPEST